MTTPSPNGSNGRDPSGRFTTGNPGGPGNPHARRTTELRAALLDAISKEDIEAVATKLVELARGGDMHAIRELLSRTIGRPEAAVTIETSNSSRLHIHEHNPEERRSRLAAISARLGVAELVDLSADADDEAKR